MNPRRLPLRRLMLVALTTLAVVLGAVAFAHDWIVRNRWVEQFTARRAVALGHLFAPMLERSLASGDPAATAAEFNRLTAIPAMRHAVLLDEHDRVLHALDPDQRNLLLAETSLRDAAPVVARARATLENHSAPSLDGRLLHAALPLSLAPQSGEIRPTRVGVFLTSSDMQQLRVAERRGTYVRTAVMGAAALLACLGFWLYFDRAFTRRFTTLVNQLGSPAVDQPSLRLPEDGGDELALIGRQVNRLSAALTAHSAALRESEARFRVMADSAPVFIWLADTAGRCIHVNRALLAFTGRSLEQETSDRGGWLEHVHPADRERLLGTFRQHFATRSPIETEFRLLRHDGTYRWIADHATPRFGPAGEFLGYVGSGIDINARREAEEELQRHTARQAVLLELSDSVIGSAPDRAALAQRIFARVSPLLESEVGFSFELRNDRLHLIASCGTPEELEATLRETALDATVCGVVAATGLPVNADATQLNGDPAAGLARRAGLRSFMCHPLRARDSRVVGTLSFGSRTRDRFSAAELEFLGTLSHLVALAWEKLDAEHALRSSEARFRELAETITEVFWISPPDKSQVHYVSPAFEKIWGVPCASLYAQPWLWLESIHPEDRTRILHRAKTRQTEGDYCEDYRIVRPDGSIRWIRDRAFPVLDANGVVVRLVGVAGDITHDIEAKEERARLAAFPELNPNPVLELGAAARILYCNAAARQLAAVLGAVTLEALLPPETPAIVTTCLATGQSRRTLEHPYGDRIVSWSFYPVAGRNTIHCYAGDVTERRRLEEQLRHAQKMDAIGQLAGGIAHDFNNILAALMLQIGLARTVPGVPTEVVETLAELDKGARRAAALTRQLLVFGRREVMRFQPLRLADLLENLTRMLRRLVGEHIAFELQTSGHDLWIDADSGMIEQVVVNLCVNARDAMPRGGSLRIRIAPLELDATGARRHVEARPGRFAALTVADSGVGMDAATLGRIFEPFFTTKEVGKGTGLGLATVASIVKQHRGWIEVESRPGQGSTFQVLFPLCPVPGPANRPADGAQGQPHRHGSHETILLVEDQPEVRQVMGMVLRGHGYRVLEAADGVEGLRCWQENQTAIRALVTDMIMPGGVSGLDLAGQIRAQRPGLPVLIFSGYTPDFIGRNDATSTYAYLAKPCETDVLLRTLRQALDTA